MTHFYSPSYGMPMRTPPSPMDDAIVRQVDWYMGRVNLQNDDYLKKKMDEDMWVSLDVILEFPKMKHLGVTDKHRVASLLQARSTVVEVDDKTCRIRPAWARRSTLFMHDVPPNVRMDQIAALFHVPMYNMQHDVVQNGALHIPPLTPPPGLLSLQPISETSWAASFDSPTGAHSALPLVADKVINGQKIIAEVHVDGIPTNPVGGNGSGIDLYRTISAQLPPPVYMPPASRPIAPQNAAPMPPDAAVHASAAPFAHGGPSMLSSPMMNAMPMPMPMLHPHHAHPAPDMHSPYANAYSAGGAPPPPPPGYVPHSYAAQSVPMGRPFMSARPLPPPPAYLVPYQASHFDHAAAAAAAAAAAHASMQSSQMPPPPPPSHVVSLAMPHTPSYTPSLATPPSALSHASPLPPVAAEFSGGGGGGGGGGSISASGSGSSVSLAGASGGVGASGHVAVSSGAAQLQNVSVDGDKQGRSGDQANGPFLTEGVVSEGNLLSGETVKSAPDDVGSGNAPVGVSNGTMGLDVVADVPVSSRQTDSRYGLHCGNESVSSGTQAPQGNVSGGTGGGGYSRNTPNNGSNGSHPTGSGGGVHNSQASHHGRPHYAHGSSHHHGGGGGYNNGMFNGRERHSNRNGSDGGNTRYGHHHHHHHHHGYQNHGHAHNHGHHGHHHHGGMGGRGGSGAIDQGGNGGRNFSHSGGAGGNGPSHYRKGKKAQRGQHTRSAHSNHHDRHSDTRMRGESRERRTDTHAPATRETTPPRSDDRRLSPATQPPTQSREVSRASKDEPNIGAMDFPPLRASDTGGSAKRAEQKPQEVAKKEVVDTMNVPKEPDVGSTALGSTSKKEVEEKESAEKDAGNGISKIDASAEGNGSGSGWAGDRKAEVISTGSSSGNGGNGGLSYAAILRTRKPAPVRSQAGGAGRGARVGTGANSECSGAVGQGDKYASSGSEGTSSSKAAKSVSDGSEGQRAGEKGSPLGWAQDSPRVDDEQRSFEDSGASELDGEAKVGSTVNSPKTEADKKPAFEKRKDGLLANGHADNAAFSMTGDPPVKKVEGGAGVKSVDAAVASKGKSGTEGRRSNSVWANKPKSVYEAAVSRVNSSSASLRGSSVDSDSPKGGVLQSRKNGGGGSGNIALDTGSRGTRERDVSNGEGDAFAGAVDGAVAKASAVDGLAEEAGRIAIGARGAWAAARGHSHWRKPVDHAAGAGAAVGGVSVGGHGGTAST